MPAPTAFTDLYMSFIKREYTVRRRIFTLLICLFAWTARRNRRKPNAPPGYDNPYYTTGTEVSPGTPRTLGAQVVSATSACTRCTTGGKSKYSNYAPRPLRALHRCLFGRLAVLYDVYGNYITQGWLVYDWTEDYPEDNGSIITKNPRFRSWFNNLLVSSSHSGQFYSALMVGDGIRTTLTPLTFSKPRFDGIQWDLITDKYALTMLSSRVSNTGEISSSEVGGGVQANTFTALMAARGRVQVGILPPSARPLSMQRIATPTCRLATTRSAACSAAR